ncbi:MAG: adenosylhomocysteinase [Clostridia bacterium]|nr:adenosylhomocysteinase [Clostridia bacterium]
MNTNRFFIADETLYPSGLDKIEWVRRNMALLNLIEDSFRIEQPFKGLRIALSVHLEAKTAYLCKVLQAGGAEMYVTGSNPLSTQDDVAAALVHEGMSVFAVHGASPDIYEKCLMRVLESEPDIIIDDGADLVTLIHTKLPHLIPKIIGGCEETTTGIHRLLAMEKDGTLRFPMFSVNDAQCKHLFDNRYGTGQSVFDGIDRTTNLIVAGKTVVVAGYGWCGRGVAMRAKGLGARVIVTEIDPIKAIEAVMDGFTVMPMSEAAKVGDVFITVTGMCDVITEAHMRSMKNGVLLSNAGHFDVEIDVAGLKRIAIETRQMKPNITGYRLDNGNWLYLLAEGRLVNLASGDGHPAEIMDMSFAIQALCARELAVNRPKEARVYAVPDAIDAFVANEKLKSIGAAVDVLTEKQKEYANSWKV